MIDCCHGDASKSHIPIRLSGKRRASDLTPYVRIPHTEHIITGNDLLFVVISWAINTL